MNAEYEIYEAPEDQIPPEDKARLDGYLRGREEALYRLELENQLEDRKEVLYSRAGKTSWS